MKILWIGHNLAFPPNRGVLQRNYNILRQAARRCEVHVVAFDQPGLRPVGVSPAECVRALREFCAEVSWLGMADGFVGGNRYWLALRALMSPDPFEMHWLRSKEMANRLQTIVKNVAFDAIHFDTLGLAQYRHLVGSCGIVLNHHNIESSMMAHRALNDSNLLRRAYWRRHAEKLRNAEQVWCPRFDVNLVVSREDENELRNVVPGIESAVVPNGTDVAYFTPRPDPGGTKLLFCGGLDWYPNLDGIRFFFETIWPKVVGVVPDVEMYIVGRNPPAWLLQLSRKDIRIHVTGFVEDIRPYAKKATAYVCPIRDGGGTRLKILDALALGLPLIATSFACSGLSLKDGDHVLLADTPQSFVHQIKKVFADKTLRQKLAKNGRGIVEREYAWDVVGGSLVEAYEFAAALSSRRRFVCH